MKLPRIMIAGTASGSGKTLVTCGILQAIVNRGWKAASFKCGPDYIDPLFHSRVIGTQSRNLDSFFCEEDMVRYLFARTAKETDFSVLEGVMGFYDGLGGISMSGSSYEIAQITDTPVILVVNCKGMSLSVVPLIQGFCQYQKDSRIAGVILNQMPESLYLPIKEQIEAVLLIKVLGYVPFVGELVIESRHLGLVMPAEIRDLHQKLEALAERLTQTLDLDEILQIAGTAGELAYSPPQIPEIPERVRIAVAKDEVFCFYYQDNLQLLEQMGAELVSFSPLHDKELPPHVDGLLLGGGYPELAADRLSANHSMLVSIYNALAEGLPCLAECGGFMYLHQQMEDMSGHSYQMVGSIAGKVYKTDKLRRFGYVTLHANKNQMIADAGDKIAGHEFHYFDSDSCGESFTARKPLREVQWSCMHGSDRLAAGFPHLYYYSNINVPYQFLNTCLDRKKTNETGRSIKAD